MEGKLSIRSDHETNKQTSKHADVSQQCLFNVPRIPFFFTGHTEQSRAGKIAPSRSLAMANHVNLACSSSSNYVSNCLEWFKKVLLKK